MIRRREFITLLGGAAVAWPLAALAQQAGKVPTIGVFPSGTPASHSQWVAAFVQRLRELGWIEGRTVAKTIGMTEVACFAANTEGPDVRMTSTLSRTNSAAISAKRSNRPSAQRTSIATVRPSIQPSSRSRCTKAALRQLSTEALVGFKNPMVGSFSACCARAPSGHTARLPTSNETNLRRFTARCLPCFRPTG